MKILSILFRILLFIIDALGFLILFRFMFFGRWDVTSRIFEDGGFFNVVFTEYLILVFLLGSMTVLMWFSRTIRHPIIIALVCNFCALCGFVYLSAHM